MNTSLILLVHSQSLNARPSYPKLATPEGDHPLPTNLKLSFPAFWAVLQTTRGMVSLVGSSTLTTTG